MAWIFSNLFINLSGKDFASLADAQAAGAATINYGLFINAVIYFLIVAFAVFLLVKALNNLMARVNREKEAAAEEAAEPDAQEKLIASLDRLTQTLEKNQAPGQ